MGRTFDVETLARVTDTTHAQLVQTLDRAVAAQIITPLLSAAGQYRFAHMLVRDTLYADLPHGAAAALPPPAIRGWFCPRTWFRYRIAQPRALALDAGGLQRRDPVGLAGSGSDTGRCPTRARRGRSGAHSRSRRPGPRRRPAIDHRRRLGPPRNCRWRSGRRMPATVSTLPLIPLGSFGVLTGIATFEPVCSSCRPSTSCRTSSAPCRRSPSRSRAGGSLHLRRDPLGLERVHDGLALGRRRAVLALQRRQRRVLAVRGRSRVAGGLDRLLEARLVRDPPSCSGSFRLVDAAPRVFMPLWEIGP